MVAGMLKNYFLVNCRIYSRYRTMETDEDEMPQLCQEQMPVRKTMRLDYSLLSGRKERIRRSGSDLVKTSGDSDVQCGIDNNSEEEPVLEGSYVCAIACPICHCDCPPSYFMGHLQVSHNWAVERVDKLLKDIDEERNSQKDTLKPHSPLLQFEKPCRGIKEANYKRWLCPLDNCTVVVDTVRALNGHVRTGHKGHHPRVYGDRKERVRECATWEEFGSWVSRNEQATHSQFCLVPNDSDGHTRYTCSYNTNTATNAVFWGETKRIDQVGVYTGCGAFIDVSEDEEKGVFVVKFFFGHTGHAEFIPKPIKETPRDPVCSQKVVMKKNSRKPKTPILSEARPVTNADRQRYQTEARKREEIMNPLLREPTIVPSYTNSALSSLDSFAPWDALWQEAGRKDGGEREMESIEKKRRVKKNVMRRPEELQRVETNDMGTVQGESGEVVHIPTKRRLVDEHTVADSRADPSLGGEKKMESNSIPTLSKETDRKEDVTSRVMEGRGYEMKQELMDVKDLLPPATNFVAPFLVKEPLQDESINRYSPSEDGLSDFDDYIFSDATFQCQEQVNNTLQNTSNVLNDLITVDEEKALEMAARIAQITEEYSKFLKIV